MAKKPAPPPARQAARPPASTSKPPQRPAPSPPQRTAAPPPPSQQVARTTSNGIAQLDDVDKLLYQHAGLGVSTRPADNITPSIAVLQPLSPTVLAGPAQIEGAHPGDFLIRGASNPLVAGKEGIWFQPAAMTEHWFEFIPRERGGGFVARYDVGYDSKGRIIPPEGAVQDELNQNSYSFAESGNNCVHYRFIAGFVWTDGVGLEYVLSFKGTGHTVARSWNTKWTRKRFPDGKMMPAFSHLYHLTTSQRTNKKGTWFQIDVSEGTHIKECEDIVLDIGKALQMGVALAQAFEQGEKMAGVPDEELTEEDIDGAGNTVDVGEDKDLPY